MGKIEKDYNKTAMDMHGELCKNIHELCVRKNKDYGSSAHDSYIDFGIVSYVIRLNDKMNRLKTLINNEQHVKDESIRDTLMDLANYSLLAIVDLDLDNISRETSEVKE